MSRFLQYTRPVLTLNGGLPHYLQWGIAVMAALTVANLHYNIPVLELISQDLGVTQVKANLISVFTQSGYVAGLLFIVALGDLLDSRRIIFTNFLVLIASFLGFALFNRIELLWVMGFLTGLCSVAVQMYIPIVAAYSRPEDKSRCVGYVVSGIIIGVLLGRVLGGVLGHFMGWRFLYIEAAIVMSVCAMFFLLLMPALKPTFHGTYTQLLRSLFQIARQYPDIIPVSIRSALAFASFNALWACLAFHIAAPPFLKGSDIVGLLGLCGLISALAVIRIGGLVDRYGINCFNGWGLLLILLSWGVLYWGGHTYAGLIIGIILIDVGQQFVGVSNQSHVLKLDATASNRINTIYMTIFFLGGSMGTFLAGQGWNAADWSGVSLVGILFALAAFVLLLRRSHPQLHIGQVTISCNHRLLPPKSYLGITLFGRIWTRRPFEEINRFVQSYPGRTFIHHESIHILQARSLGGWLIFYPVYLWYWLKLYLVSFNMDMAYRTNPFEMEAYENERNFDYQQSHWKKYRRSNKARRELYHHLTVR